MRFAGAISLMIVALAVLTSLDAPAAEVWAASVYAPLLRVSVVWVSAAPWSWTALLLAAAPLAVILLARLRGPWAWARAAAAVALFFWLAATAVWGVHYQRAPWAERLGLPLAVSDGDIDALADYLRDVVIADSGAAEGAPAPVEAAVASIARSHEELAQAAGAPGLVVPRSVKTVAPGFLLGFGASGVISPWLLEAHVDGALPAAARVAVSAHELAHLAGHAREDDAEAAGTVAGLRAEHPYARYASALYALAALEAQRPSGVTADPAASLPEVARSDLRAAEQVAARYRDTRRVRASRWLYDRYLRAQGVPEGIASYGGAITLLARAWAAGVVTPPPLR